jgi:hypothetical protein
MPTSVFAKLVAPAVAAVIAMSTSAAAPAPAESAPAAPTSPMEAFNQMTTRTTPTVLVPNPAALAVLEQPRAAKLKFIQEYMEANIPGLNLAIMSMDEQDPVAKVRAALERGFAKRPPSTSPEEALLLRQSAYPQIAFSQRDFSGMHKRLLPATLQTDKSQIATLAMHAPMSFYTPQAQRENLAVSMIVMGRDDTNSNPSEPRSIPECGANSYLHMNEMHTHIHEVGHGVNWNETSLSWLAGRQTASLNLRNYWESASDTFSVFMMTHLYGETGLNFMAVNSQNTFARNPSHMTYLSQQAAIAQIRADPEAFSKIPPSEYGRMAHDIARENAIHKDMFPSVEAYAQRFAGKRSADDAKGRLTTPPSGYTELDRRIDQEITKEDENQLLKEWAKSSIKDLASLQACVRPDFEASERLYRAAKDPKPD